MRLGGIIAGAMSGGGEALGHVGKQLGEHTSRSILQKELAEISKARDERLSELRRGELEFAEDLRRAPARAAAKEIDAARTGVVDDLSGTMRTRTPSEMAEVEEGAYRKQGLVQEAMQVRTLEQQRSRDNDTKLSRARDDERADAQLQLSRDTFDVNAKGASLERQIKQITLDNAKRVDELRKEFAGATPERKLEIQEEVQLLSGKSHEKFLPVAIKDETGAITGYQIFDTTRGRWVDQPGGAGGGKAPTAADIEGLVARAKDPKAVKFFEEKFGQGAAARYLPKAEAGKPDEGKPQEPGALDARKRRELETRTTFGRLTPKADLEMAVRLGNKHAVAEVERRKKRDEERKKPARPIPYQAP